MKIYSKNKGFSLIELMIVIAIIGILATVALPAYQDYTSRAKVAEPVGLMRAMKTDIHKYVGEKGSFPTVAELNDYIGVKVSSGKFTASIGDGAPGVYIATMRDNIGARISGSTVALHFATNSDGLLNHTCRPGGVNPVPNEYLPWECRSTP
ncbi:pilin [Pseudoteredinibacter isoporae]|uniref:Type IV pilus assembly protein PilA n=1 Tax=Pseudoteredinibacter isoporae TaxID=570281 RepID=A0A7X0JUU9_9GAMM|nr:pilin [Pseudoteredinibacter isoporae]MBB6522703.1 type IV pilus assembly protein PilA [Pseudoteredinibacter isoporae]